MTNLAMITETALLLLAAYLLGCVVGYAVRRILHAARGTHRVGLPVEAVATPAQPVTETVTRPRSTAARLAASVGDQPEPVPAPATARTTPKPGKPVVKPSIVPAAEKPAPKPTLVPATRKPAAKKSADPKPMTLSAPRAGGADNLKQIKGIGPKIETSLHSIGIFHLDQIAAWNRANVDWVDAQLSFKGRIRRERWVEQAAELSKTRASA